MCVLSCSVAQLLVCVGYRGSVTGIMMEGGRRIRGAIAMKTDVNG